MDNQTIDLIAGVLAVAENELHAKGAKGVTLVAITSEGNVWELEATRGKLFASGNEGMVDYIKRITEQAFGIPIGSIMTPSRSPLYVNPRQVAMVTLGKVHPAYKPEEIGSFFDRDRTAYSYAIKKYDCYCQTEAEYSKTAKQVLQKAINYVKEIESQGKLTELVVEG